MITHYPILVVGGGNAGISVSAQLLNKNKKLQLAIIEPSDKHYYQPAWSLVGAGMKTSPGIAAKMFRVLADEKINIEMISTSEIKVSVVIDEKYTELAVRVLHKAFALDQPV